MDSLAIPPDWQKRALPVLVSMIERNEPEDVVRWVAESLASRAGAPREDVDKIIEQATDQVMNYSDIRLERKKEVAESIAQTTPKEEPLRLRDVRKGSLFVYQGTTYKKISLNTGKPRYGNEITIPSDTVVSKPIKPPSRQDRWNTACQEARDALDSWRDSVDQVNNAFETLREIQSEFSDWKDNLDGKFEGSALSEKLENITSIDLDADAEQESLGDLESKLDEAEGAELPLGFGRD
jgi:hypothetical protein